jgi:hypothetical protein
MSPDERLHAEMENKVVQQGVRVQKPEIEYILQNAEADDKYLVSVAGSSEVEAPKFCETHWYITGTCGFNTEFLFLYQYLYVRADLP